MPSELEGLRALLVEDDADVRELVELLLVDHGAEVLGVASLAAARAACAEGVFQVILTDLSLAGDSGFDLIEEFMKHPETREIPIIAVTGFAAGSTRQRALGLGAREVLLKPVEPASLLSAILSVAAPKRAM